ncbi:MAG TPA: LpqB family beta-propeller domain-containing protein [Micromonospora sp.]|nr:LpqB family beta-propeller domain-containing protein [Micromonospora sp.]
MRLRPLTAVLLAVLLAAVLTACGIPDETGVHVEGAGPARGDGADGPPPDEPTPRADAGNDPKTFVTNYLLAAAGEIGGAYERVKEYIAPEPINRGDLREPQGQEEIGINIVRLTAISVNHGQDLNSTVTIKVQQVGVLRSDGAVHPPELTDTSYELIVGEIDINDTVGQSRRDQPESKGFWVIKPPPVLLMSEQALERYYQQHTIYFWSKDRQALVADLRHLPLAVPESRRADELVGWLTRGPSWEGLRDAVAALPAGTQKIGNVTQDKGRLVVNLATDLGPNPKGELEKLGTQLIWSLGEYNAAELEIKIKDESREVIPTEIRRGDWPVYPVDAPQRFAAYDGAIHPLRNPGAAQGNPDGGAMPASVPLVGPAKSNITAADFTFRSGGVWAALVVWSGEKRRLLVGTGADVVETFDQSRTFAKMRRPIWLRSRSDDPDGLIVADGELYRFGPGVSLIPVPLQGHRTVTAVAAALDGHRIAFIADGALYVAALTVSGDTVKVHRERRLHTLLNDVTAVEWIGENRLVVAGSAGDGQVALYDIGDDGARETLRRPTGGTATITHLAAYAENPVRPNDYARVMYEVNEVAWDEQRGERLDAEQVEGLPEPPDDETHTHTAPTAPFFVY